MTASAVAFLAVPPRSPLIGPPSLNNALWAPARKRGFGGPLESGPARKGKFMSEVASRKRVQVKCDDRDSELVRSMDQVTHDHDQVAARAHRIFKVCGSSGTPATPSHLWFKVGAWHNLNSPGQSSSRLTSDSNEGMGTVSEMSLLILAVVIFAN